RRRRDEAAALQRVADRARGDSVREPQRVARLGASPAREQVAQQLPPPCQEQVVARVAAEQRAARRRLEKRHVQEPVRRPPHAVCAQRPRRDRPEYLELVADLDELPIVEIEMADDGLLPLALLGGRGIREAKRDRDRRIEPLMTGSAGGPREHDRGVAASGEADEARGAAQRGRRRALKTLQRREGGGGGAPAAIPPRARAAD